MEIFKKKVNLINKCDFNQFFFDIQWIVLAIDSIA